MGTAVERAYELTEYWHEKLRADLPSGADIFDAHTHIGDDIDGMRGRPDELLSIMDGYGISQAFTFCMDEPDRHPAFSAANDRTRAWTEETGGRLIPFVRLDLAESPIEEAERCLDLGARGIKLHPRAQGFLLTDERLEPVFALAAERRVPILIHGGRGLPPISRASPGSSIATRKRSSSSPMRGSPTWPGSPTCSARAPASSSTRRRGAPSTCSTSTARSRPSRCSTPRTTRTGSSRARC